jgi:hypothetical protein
LSVYDYIHIKESCQCLCAFSCIATNNKPVAFVCHSPGAKTIKVNGEYLVKGKNYWFSNTEEEEAVD